jgi:hydrogenase maturation protease
MPVPPEVALLDGGTGGLALLHVLADMDVVVLLDAVDFGGRPGEIRTFTPSEARSCRPAPVSSHEGDVLRIVALAERLGACPRHIAVCAIQPARIAPAQGLTASVAVRLPALSEEVIQTLRTMLRDAEVD